MPLAAGTRIGSYEILSALGRGGMGEVYRARDPKLNRDVAIKVLLPSVAHDGERLSRFRREAQVLASLNHQNIAHVHGFEDAGEHGGLVMELVEGPTLADRIARGPLPLDEALPIARQIADALGAAHEQAVIHRDLKPANIKVRVDGTVKVLDFGLAKALDESGSGERDALPAAPTITAALTLPGQILGTAAYMSPEQIKGAKVDRRADLWAFGCVLFEMLTGRRPFAGESSAEVIARIVERDPDWQALPASTPGAIRTLLRRCLEKDAKRRLDSAAAAQFEIDDALARPGESGNEPRAAAKRWPQSAVLVVAALLVTLAGLSGFLAWTSSRPGESVTAPVSRIAITLPPSQPLAYSFNDRDFAISTDGTRLVYTAGDQAHLMVRNLDALDAEPLAGITNARAPFLSPDGRWIGFSDRLDEGTNVGAVIQRGALRRVPATGGPASIIAQLIGASRGASWGPDDSIVFATSDPSTGLLRVRATGGEPDVLTKPDERNGERDHYFPSLLPAGRGVLFTVVSGGGQRQVAVLDLRTGQHKILIRSGGQAEFLDTGHLLYADGGALWAVRFNLATLDVAGDPVLVERILTYGANSASAFSLSSRTLVYVPPAEAGLRSLVWVNRQGGEEPISAPPRDYRRLRLSPDGTRAALALPEPGTQHIWTLDLANGQLSRLTFERSVNTNPLWTLDGRHIIYGSTVAPNVNNLYRLALDGTGREERLTTSESTQRPTSITRDGTRVLFEQLTPSAGYDVWAVSLSGPPRVEPVLQGAFDERNAEISPDGRWLAYESNESDGRQEIYVRPFPAVSDAIQQVSVGGGRAPAWAGNGRELFFVTRTSVMSAQVQLTPSFKAGNPTRLFDAYPYLLDGRVIGAGTIRNYDVAPDGQRFLMIKDAASANLRVPNLVVVQNWHQELKARLSAAGQ